MNSAEPVDEPEAHGVTTRRVGGLLLAAALLLLALYVIGVVPRLRTARRLAAEAEVARQKLPLVQTTQPHRAPAAVALPLSGNIHAILETGISARTDGYLKERFVDVGSHVAEGQLLAIIDTPEVDQQLNLGLADLREAQANVSTLEADLALGRTTLQRYLQAGPGTVSKQQIDDKTASVTTGEKALEAARATVAANEANVQRLLDLQRYRRVYAPFTGIITARNVDPGALISAESADGGVREMFRLSRVDRLRIFVDVPQFYASEITGDMSADVTVREFPRHVFDGIVTRIAGAIDTASRTVQVEVQVPNPDGILLPGSDATVHFQISRLAPPLLIPSNALLVDAAGVRVALVGPDNTLQYRAIDLGRDFGDEVEVLSGLTTDDTVAIGISGRLVEGSAVTVATRAPNPTVVEPPAQDPAGAGASR